MRIKTLLSSFCVLIAAGAVALALPAPASAAPALGPVTPPCGWHGFSVAIANQGLQDSAALEIIITPPLTARAVPGFIDGQRVIAGVAMEQMKPAALAGGTRIGPGASRGLALPHMPTWAMITVIAGWIVVWSALGAWKMATRDT